MDSVMISTPRLPAQAMAAAVATDPQFRLPAMPKLVDGVAVVPLPDGLLFEGTGERQVLRGRDAASLVPQLLPLLDGCRDLDELAAALPEVPAAHVRAAVSLLYTCGLLEDLQDADDVADLDADGPAARFFGRHLDTTRVNRNTAQVLRRLASARVTLVGDAAIADATATALRQAGLRHIVVCDAEAGPPDEEATLVVGLTSAGEDDDRRLESLDEWAASRGVPWLHSAITGGTVLVGPYFDRRHSACFTCFRRARAVAASDQHPSHRRMRMWAALVATEVVYLLGRVGHLISTSGWSELDPQSWSQRTLSLPRLPGCPTCLPMEEPAADVHIAHHYEQAVAFPPRSLLNPKDHMHHYRPGNIALQREGKRYPSAPKELLPAPHDCPAPRGTVLSWLSTPEEPSAPLTLECLAGLLLRVTGLRPDGDAPSGKVQRWAPTGGNLGSVQAYILAVDLAGLAAGWYFYDPHTHALSILARAPDLDVRQAATAVAGDALPPGASAFLVLTGALSKVAKKYGDFGYRIVCLDAGVAVAQAVAVARGVGLDARIADHWDDEEIVRQLDLQRYAEPVTAVLGLYGRTAHAT